MMNRFNTLLLAALLAVPSPLLADPIGTASQVLGLCAGSHPDGKKAASAFARAGFVEENREAGITFYRGPDGVVAMTSPKNETQLRCGVTFEGMTKAQALALAEAMVPKLDQVTSSASPQKEIVGIWLGKLNGKTALLTAVTNTPISSLLTGSAVLLAAI